jgi:serine/threonine protein kinase, bacterial
MIEIDSIHFQLRDVEDFAWLKDLGRVFCVFDQQDSGNICFGVEKNGRKRFIKYAGAKTLHYEGKPQDAITRLQQTIPIYQALKHPHLIALEEHFETENGYLAIFAWFDGECLHPHWLFDRYDKYTHPKSSYYKYRKLPIANRLKSLDDIFSFHVHVESQGYVAIDFYDGSILYDFKNDITKICDIDFYHRKPVLNSQGEDFSGSKRFKSPEEYEPGAAIDEKTNVYNMGAMAFGLLGGELDHSIEKWEAGDELYDIACKATEKDRNKRYASVRVFYEEWQEFAENILNN